MCTNSPTLKNTSAKKSPPKLPEKISLAKIKAKACGSAPIFTTTGTVAGAPAAEAVVEATAEATDAGTAVVEVKDAAAGAERNDPAQDEAVRARKEAAEKTASVPNARPRKGTEQPETGKT
jgi:hypothetical protein